MFNPFKVIGDVVSNAVMKHCTFENDTKYKVIVVDHDGTRALYPGQSEENYIANGFSVDLVMVFSDTDEAKVNFPSSRYESRNHKMSYIFKEDIENFEADDEVSTSEFNLQYNI